MLYSQLVCELTFFVQENSCHFLWPEAVKTERNFSGQPFLDHDILFRLLISCRQRLWFCQQNWVVSLSFRNFCGSRIHVCVKMFSCSFQYMARSGTHAIIFILYYRSHNVAGVSGLELNLNNIDLRNYPLPGKLASRLELFVAQI